MERPAIVYLDAPVKINGFHIRHSKEGLTYLIDHYTQMLAKEVSVKIRSREVADHMQTLVTEWKYHLTLYDTINEKNNISENQR